MTSERRQDMILVTLVLSVALHVALMFYARPRVMTHVAAGMARPGRHEMQVMRQDVRPQSVRIDVIRDVAAKKDSPKAEEGLSIPVVGLDDPTDKVSMPEPKVKVPEPINDLVPQEEALAKFSMEKIKVVVGPKEAPARMVSTQRPVNMPLAAVRDSPVTTDHPAVVAVPAVKIPEILPPAVITAPELDRTVPPIEPKKEPGAGKEPFKPAEEVYTKVDEKIVEQEKRAVRDMLDVHRANDLVSAVDLNLVTFATNGWTYFRVTLGKNALPVVSKDVVVLIDASGSIGGDRLNSCRKAARQLLRTITNTGDRFNLVAFRDRFSYAFRTWRECDVVSFKMADSWLNNLAAHGRTDVFSTISSILTLPRNPSRPLIALVVTDGDANAGVSDTADILSEFTALNDGLVSVYMYGVKSTANRELIDVLTHGTRGESMIFDGWRWSAGDALEKFATRFRDPVLSDLRIVFTASSRAEALPRVLKNLYRGNTVEIVGRVPAPAKTIAFSLRGLNGDKPYEGFFRLPVAASPSAPELPGLWKREQAIDAKLR